jgi:DNA polymerase-3 subunit delta
MDANVKKILATLQKQQYAPVYFLQGEESYYIDLIADYIEEHALPEADRSFNQVVLYGKDVNMATILTHARRYPMMAEKQVVIVKEAQDIQDLTRETGSKLLLEYFKNPVPSTILVFCHKHKPLDGRRELAKQVDAHAVVLKAKRPYENQLPDFIQGYVDDKGVRIEDQAVQALCGFVGNDLHRLANEVDKLIITLGTETTITLELVLRQVGISKEYNIFELQRAILKGDAVMANKIVNYFEGNTRRNPVIPAVAFLYSFFSKLLAATQVADQSEKGLVSALKVSPYAARDYTIALRQFGHARLLRIISSLKEADLMLKGVDAGSITEGQILRGLVWRLTNDSID